MNYRSAMVFGRGRPVQDDAEKLQVFDEMVQRYFPGRKVCVDYNGPPPTDLGITSLVEIKIEEWSGKIRMGGPTGPDDDNASAFGSAGTIDL